nr:hypothetical protein Iba_chr02aCG20630 [Ipomoea batatas]GMC61599.1 hypothetical protein Iba_chr02bCG21550 [Ipomoea batatas]GMC65508.1 hypothetical protein Iba_chr02dCG14860 [Ipomoea batatas]
MMVKRILSSKSGSSTLLPVANRVMRNLVLFTVPSVVTNPFFTSKPKSFRDFIVSIRAPRRSPKLSSTAVASLSGS